MTKAKDLRRVKDWRKGSRTGQTSQKEKECRRLRPSSSGEPVTIAERLAILSGGVIIWVPLTGMDGETAIGGQMLPEVGMHRGNQLEGTQNERVAAKVAARASRDQSL